MITEEKSNSLATAWLAAWNNHDLDAALLHYTDDFVTETPMAANVMPESSGKIQGKAAIRAYWEIALSKIPNLRFEMIDVLTGVDSVTIYYLNTATGKKAAEVLFLNPDGLAEKSVVHYS